MKLHLVSLGCAKNLVDSEVMLGKLVASGWETVVDPEKADLIIVNTCSFIEDAAQESIDTILELTQFKKTGKCKTFVVAGCLPQRFGQKIADALPEVDLFTGTAGFDKILHIIE